MVRSRENTLARIAKELPDRKNIHIVEGDLASYQSLEVRFLKASHLIYVIETALIYYIACCA